MNRELAKKASAAVLYEGYRLDPCWPLSRNSQERWNGCVLFPSSYEEVAKGRERARMHSECLLRLSNESTVVHLQFSFLQDQLSKSSRRNSARSVVSADFFDAEGDRRISITAVRIERSVEIKLLPEDELQQMFQFGFDVLEERDISCDFDLRACGSRKRHQNRLEGTILVAFERLASGVMKLGIDIENVSPFTSGMKDRDEALLSAFVTAHTVLGIEGGEFVSLLDPPIDLREAAAGCKNVGSFPVLIGTEGASDMMLCSPIPLHDYPQFASAGGFFDAEMEEIVRLPAMPLISRLGD